MKHFVVKYLMLLAICFLCSQQSRAQRIYVTVQPGATVVARPAAPAHTYVWIEGEWIPMGRTYVYQPGYWVAPRPHYVWMPGHWAHIRRGWYWVSGHWART
ncbi:hypothetical protein FC093_15250 [Ilyomonas limi]|uniref:YXWGXW repeat-containing protein n=1 Tax=Ilyomonas limi TaxID=2575867 RepID=A0A4U3L1B7_9BACT|nr:YXWGXW repeat-containing protein [Ilyomonas limi]TKK67237.1 hypothetical protein FC093_15250 [Ilyomonas limi]